MKKRILSILLALTVVTGVLAACNRTKPAPDGNSGTTVTEIRYLNFKPEIAEVYKRISEAYEKETGVRLIVETAASGTYESTLTARMATDEAPTIFQINGPIGYASWADYCADLKNTELYKHLTDKALAVDLHVVIPDPDGVRLRGGDGNKFLHILDGGEPYFKFLHKIPPVTVQTYYFCV